MKRIDKETYYLNIAAEVAGRSTCLQRTFGAVIVNHDQIVGTGYNGAPRGVLNCCDSGVCPRKEANVPRGTRYEMCVSVHAEQNAIINAGRERCMGATLYLIGFERPNDPDDEWDLVSNIQPCAICKRMIINAGITHVVALGYGNTHYYFRPEEWTIRDLTGGY